MGLKKREKEFWESTSMNSASFNYYYNRLVEIAISRFEWEGLPDSIDKRFLELVLCTTGHCVFFKDEFIGYLALRAAIAPPLDNYNIPKHREAYANNGYHMVLNETNSVLIYNNLIRTIPKPDIVLFAKRLYSIDRIIDVNTNAQKTPILIKGSQETILTLKNMYMKYDGNEPFMFGDSSLNTDDSFIVLKTDAPFICDKLYELRSQIWNDALTYLGIHNSGFMKKERLYSKEAERAGGGVEASRNSALEARKIACEQINKMFNLNISCKFKDQTYEDDAIKNNDDKIENKNNEKEEMTDE